MSSLTNINQSSSVVNVGRTVPVSTGQTTSDKSIPVVVAEDQTPIPVVEQNKIQSEVALSLLGIPRSEVALGIFADVNTYDVNPTEWSSSPEVYTEGHGIKHSPNEAGAIVEAPRDKTSVLTSKRFFRYQPGRVSAATFGIKCSVSNLAFAQNPVIKKYGIFDKYDGYYWETRQNGQGDNFTVVRRTQSLYKNPTSPFGVKGDDLRGYDAANSGKKKLVNQTEDYRIVGSPPVRNATESTLYLKERKKLIEARFAIADQIWTNLLAGTNDLKSEYNGLANQTLKDEFEAKCKRDLDFWIDMYLADLAASVDSTAHTAINTKNYETSLAVVNNSPAAEIALHTEAKSYLATYFAAESDDFKARIATLSQIPITFFNSITGPNVATYPTPVWPSTDLKVRFEIIFNVRKHYWAYIIATYESIDAYSTPATFVTSAKTTYPSEEIRYKCQRDMVYVIDGYKDDVLGGGNAATKYNASMYYKGPGYSVFTMKETGSTVIPKEISRHTNLKSLINRDLTQSYYGFSGTSGNSYRTAVQSLSDLIINNLKYEDTRATIYGERGVAGNLVVLRDGLIMTHAAVYDASLLKDAKQIKVKITAGTPVKFKLVEDTVTFGQHIRYFGATNGSASTGLVNNKLYKVSNVYGPKGNEFSIKNTDGSDVVVANTTTEAKFQLVNPFIIPDVYNVDTAEYNVVGPMFPYLYTKSGSLPQGDEDPGFGYIDTAINTTVNPGKMMTQIDSVNFEPEFINWIKNNVKPEYYGVYEFRIPRSRFSTDQLNGDLNKTVYSDVATGNGSPVRPGQTVKTVTGSSLETQSVYDFDFTKVTMLKIEFSWYGAVGALFLAYVPVGNGEARWVRVHHLRASNQLKIASLGNATLPITYLVYGGGSVTTLGDGETTPDYGYGRNSHNLVKYGASYYIDGGDRGTVRLYSYNNDATAKVYGKQFAIGNVTYAEDSTLGLTYFTRNDTSLPVKNVFFMGAKIKTSSRIDQNIKVVWTTSSRIYLSKYPSDTNVILIPDRSNTVYGLETKKEIVSSNGARVRNRVQVYPTKMSTANLGTTTPIRLRMKKTPRFQTSDTTAVGVNFTLSSEYEITSENKELSIAAGSQNYLDDGESVYGWFRGKLGIDRLTVFGRLYKVSTFYYFELLETYNGTVTLEVGSFLCDLRFGPEGNILTGITKITEEKEGLSSVEIATQEQVPIPGTGVDIATLYLKPGTEQIDLSSYYDYNKEYLSYPLTDVADSLYLIADTETVFAVPNPTSVDLSISITWEEQ